MHDRILNPLKRMYFYAFFLFHVNIFKGYYPLPVSNLLEGFLTWASGVVLEFWELFITFQWHCTGILANNEKAMTCFASVFEKKVSHAFKA